jgi:hypothetical protein
LVFNKNATFFRTKWRKMPIFAENYGHNQGDQIGQIFACWAVVYFVRFLEKK